MMVLMNVARQLLILLFVVVLIVSTPKFSSSNESKNHMDQVCGFDEHISLLENVDMEKRYEGLNKINTNIVKCPMTKKITNLVLYLAEDNKKTQELYHRGELGEEYLTELIIALGNTKDSRSVEYLIPELGSGTLVLKSLLNIGDHSINKIISRLDSEHVGYRISGAQALEYFISPKTGKNVLSEISKTKIKKVVLKQLNDHRNEYPSKNINFYKHRVKEKTDLRIYLVKTLGHLAKDGDESLTPIIKKIAEEDSYFEENGKNNNYKNPNKHYLVRDVANSILMNLN